MSSFFAKLHDSSLLFDYEFNDSNACNAHIVGFIYSILGIPIYRFVVFTAFVDTPFMVRLHI